MTSSPSPDFALVASRYDELRPADAHWWERFELLVRAGDLGGRRVLDIGCGTGTLASALAERHRCRVWGVEPSPEMLAIARAKVGSGVGLKVGRAEELPFRDAWFERATASLVIHLVDRRRAFAEARRVLAAGGRFVAATFHRDHIHGYYLNPFFPSIPAIDLPRFPETPALESELERAGFEPVLSARLSQHGVVDRAETLRRIRGRHISTLQLVDEEEYGEGLARAERELPERVEYTLEHLVVTGDVPG